MAQKFKLAYILLGRRERERDKSVIFGKKRMEKSAIGCVSHMDDFQTALENY